MAFDFFLNNSERLTVINYNASFNRLTFEDSDEVYKYLELTKENINGVTLWDGRKMNFDSFCEYVKSELY